MTLLVKSGAYLDLLLHARVAKRRYKLVRLHIVIVTHQQPVCRDQGVFVDLLSVYDQELTGVSAVFKKFEKENLFQIMCAGRSIWPITILT